MSWYLVFLCSEPVLHQMVVMLVPDVVGTCVTPDGCDVGTCVIPEACVVGTCVTPDGCDVGTCVCHSRSLCCRTCVAADGCDVVPV